jgi:hypothetical protein
MSDSTAPRTFTVAMARARHPAVGRNRIYTALQAGVLPSVAVGKRTAIDVDDLDDWVRDGCPLVVHQSAQGPSSGLAR